MSNMTEPLYYRDKLTCNARISIHFVFSPKVRLHNIRFGTNLFHQIDSQVCILYFVEGWKRRTFNF